MKQTKRQSYFTIIYGICLFLMINLSVKATPPIEIINWNPEIKENIYASNSFFLYNPEKLSFVDQAEFPIFYGMTLNEEDEITRPKIINQIGYDPIGGLELSLLLLPLLYGIFICFKKKIQRS